MKHPYTQQLDEYITNTSQEYGRPIEPKFTCLMDGAGKVFFFGVEDNNITSEQRLKMLGAAFKAMHNVVEGEKRAMREAKAIDMSRLKKI